MTGRRRQDKVEEEKENGRKCIRRLRRRRIGVRW